MLCFIISVFCSVLAVFFRFICFHNQCMDTIGFRCRRHGTVTFSTLTLLVSNIRNICRSFTACSPKVEKIANKSEGLSSKCSHLWTSRHQRVSLAACVTEAYARLGNAINHDPDRHRCNVKRCNNHHHQTPGKHQLNDVTNDVIHDDDVTALDYRLTDIHGAWDVYAIFCKCCLDYKLKACTQRQH